MERQIVVDGMLYFGFLEDKSLTYLLFCELAKHLN